MKMEMKMEPMTIPVVRGHLGALGSGGDDKTLCEPLHPALMTNLGLDNPVPKGDGFDPFGSWRICYRIWGNHGWTWFQNKNMGHLEIIRCPAENDIRFEVRQVIVNTDGMFQVVEAELRCCPDHLASLIDWSARTTCYDFAQCPMPELSMRTEGRVEKNQVILSVNGRPRQAPLAKGPLISQWTIVDLLQRGNQACGPDFTALEHDRKLKPGHRLEISHVISPERTANGLLQPFLQLGSGMLPWEYWRDSHQRILYAFSGSVMLALDEEAPRKTAKLIEELVQGGHHYEY